MSVTVAVLMRPMPTLVDWLKAKPSRERRFRRLSSAYLKHMLTPCTILDDLVFKPVDGRRLRL